ncbi:hypothetical protein [Senegalia massiliensis]|uniref:hypothetical protein n=1 Tax=Senegalia massiliensis TaxID=1720316 RepID=UPI001030175B|nr:hypothetical protein [Senegalia massiliensis]
MSLSNLKHQLLKDNGFELNNNKNIYINKNLHCGFNVDVLEELSLSCLIRAIRKSNWKMVYK